MKNLTINKILKTTIIVSPLFLMMYSIYVLSSVRYTVNNSFFYGIIYYLIGYIGLRIIELNISYFNSRNSKLSTISLGVMFFLGCFNVITFSHIDIVFSLQLSILPTIGLNLISLVLLLLYLIVYYKELRKIFVNTDLNSSRPKKEILDEDIDYFVKIYSDKSIEELRDILDNSGSYRECAIQASRKLLEDKTSSKI